MRVFKVGLAVLVLIVLVLAGGLFFLNQYLQSPAFKQAVLRSAHDALGSDVQVGEMRVSLFSGVTLGQVVVTNPPGFPGNLLRADALVVHYRLWPLLRKRLEVDQVSLEGPALHVARSERGEWNYEQLAAKASPTTAATPPHPAGPAEGSTGTPAAPGAVSGLDVILPKLVVTRGSLVVRGERERPLARIDQLDLASALTWTGGALSGTGRTTIETINVADSLFVRRLDTPLAFTAADITLAPLSGKLADGTLSGSLTVRLRGGLRYAATLQVKDADVEKLLQEAHARHRVITGRLQTQATLEGTGGLPTLVGRGRAEIRGGRLVDVPIMRTLEVLLQVPGLRDLKFDECRVDFTVADQVLQTPAIRIASRDLEITGKGAVSLSTATLNHEMTLALPMDIVRRAPREVRAAFRERPDGWMLVDFRLWGRYDEPKTDLQDKLMKGMTEGLLRKGLQQLFR